MNAAMAANQCTSNGLEHLAVRSRRHGVGGARGAGVSPGVRRGVRLIHGVDLQEQQILRSHPWYLACIDSLGSGTIVAAEEEGLAVAGHHRAGAVLGGSERAAGGVWAGNTDAGGDLHRGAYIHPYAYTHESASVGADTIANTWA
jgi:hypothetical protein